MDTLSAFAMGQAHRNSPSRVFDWDKAAWLIRSTNATRASAGLRDDWDYTGGVIYADGQPVPEDETYVFLASTWAVPELELDGELMPCWRWADETPGWDSGTYWPESAREVVRRLELESGD